MSSEYILIVF